jgi:hypothetical protein
MSLKTGSVTQDACGDWYVNFQCEGNADIGIALGLKDHFQSFECDGIWILPIFSSASTSIAERKDDAETVNESGDSRSDRWD